MDILTLTAGRWGQRWRYSVDYAVCRWFCVVWFTKKQPPKPKLPDKQQGDIEGIVRRRGMP